MEILVEILVEKREECLTTRYVVFETIIVSVSHTKFVQFV